MIPEYTNHLYALGRAPGTVRQRLRHIDRLADLHPNLMKVTTADLEAVLAKMRTDGLESETRKAARSSYRSFYGWAAREGLIKRDPSAPLGPVKVTVRVPRFAPDDVVTAALAHAELRERTMILLARLACLRLTELSTLHMSAREHDTLRVVGKGEKERIVYINDDLMRTLLEREHEIGADNYYFPGRFAAYMHPQSVNKIMTRATGCNPHSLRHAGATAAYNATHDLRAVQVMLGHSSLATTQRYLHINEVSQRAVATGTALGAHHTAV